jgi:hypothetical protein
VIECGRRSKRTLVKEILRRFFGDVTRGA